MTEENSKVQSRKILLTLNNPQESGYDHELIAGLARKLGLQYFCLADEIGNQSHTYHTHLFMYRPSPIRFRTIKKTFPTAHIDIAYGTAKENRDYIRKEGKWENTDKAETRVPGTFYEEGIMPTESEERSPRKARLLDLIKSGASDSQILDADPTNIFHIKDFEQIRQTYLADKYSTENRDVDVTYIFGPTGVGKTRSIYQSYPARDICRITSYRANSGALFDAYKGQNVLVLDEYKGQIPIEELLTYLDRYPVMLRARYYDRVAAYTKVYILSNIALEDQYCDIQKKTPQQYSALLRRIANVIQMETEDGKPLVQVKKGHWNLTNENIIFKA